MQDCPIAAGISLATDEEGELVLFESGAIVLHVADRHAGLLPDERYARARAIAWVFAALNAVEPPILARPMVVILERDRSWHEERLATRDDRAHVRLRELSDRLGDAGWLGGAFSVGDLLKLTVLRK